MDTKDLTFGNTLTEEAEVQFQGKLQELLNSTFGPDTGYMIILAPEQDKQYKAQEEFTNWKRGLLDRAEEGDKDADRILRENADESFLPTVPRYEGGEHINTLVEILSMIEETNEAFENSLVSSENVDWDDDDDDLDEDDTVLERDDKTH